MDHPVVGKSAPSTAQLTADRSAVEPGAAQLIERRRTLLVASAGTFIALTSFTMPMSSLTALATGLGAGPAGQTWVLSSMSVGLAAGLLICGTLGDDYGRRRVFLLGAVLVVLTTLLGVAARSPWLFVLARIGQGLGAAALIACGLGLIGHAFPAGADRAKATGVWGASLGAGIACGPLLAVALNAVAGWRAGYLLIALCTLVVAVAGRILLVESRAERPHPVDLVGAVLLGLGLSALLAGLVAGRGGWARLLVVALLVSAVLLLVGFVLVELRLGRRGQPPLLDLALFRRRDFVAVTVAGLATGMGVIAVMSFLPTICERALGIGPLPGAAALATWAGISVPTSLAARRLRMNGDLQLAVSLLVVAAGVAMLGGLHPGDGVSRLMPGLLIAGLGSGVLNAALGRQAVSSVPPGRAGMGSGANNTARYLGSAVGVTVVAVLAAGSGTGGLLAGWDTAVLAGVVFSVLGALAVLLCLRRR